MRDQGHLADLLNPDYDKECAPALARIAREAQTADWLAKFEKTKANKAWAVRHAQVTRTVCLWPSLP